MVEEKLSNKDTQTAKTSICGDNVNQKRREPNKKNDKRPAIQYRGI